MKLGKDPGLDEILVKYLKVYGNAYEDLKLLNKVFSSNMYPKICTPINGVPVFRNQHTKKGILMTLTILEAWP